MLGSLASLSKEEGKQSLECHGGSAAGMHGERVFQLEGQARAKAERGERTWQISAKERRLGEP